MHAGKSCPLAGSPKIGADIQNLFLAYSIIVSMLGNVKNSHTHLNFYNSHNSQQPHIYNLLIIITIYIREGLI